MNLIKLTYRTIGLLFILLFLFVGCSEKKSQTVLREKYIIPDSILKKMIFDTVRNCSLVDAITLTGTVDFNQDNQVNIFPMVSGNIQDVKVQIGDYVQAGQTLAIVKSSEMAGYGTSLINAEANLRVTQKTLDAQKDLFKSGLASQLDVLAAQSNYDQALSQLDYIKKVLKINGNNTQGDYIIKAPISGFIVQKNITNNTAIRSDNGMNLFTISDLKKVWVQANVYESNISKIHLGEDVSITTVSYPDKVFKGRVDKILNVLDPTNKVLKVRIVLDNTDYLLKPQMFTRIIVTNKLSKSAICISTKAIIFDHSQYYVLKYNGKGNAVITQVHVINNIGNTTYLVDGVNEGDILVGSDAILVYDALNN